MPAEGPKQLQPGQVVVALAAGAAGPSAAVRQAIAREYDVAERGSFPLASIGLECVVFQVGAGRSVPELLARLARDPRIVLAEPNQVFRGRAGPTAAPPEPLAYGAALIHADAAQRTRTGRGIRVAVIDTGVARDHPGLHGRVTAAQNFVEGGEVGFDRDRHGTAVAGVVAAGGATARARGVAPDADVLALKACWYDGGAAGTALCSSWTLAKALDHAIGAGARIVNMSLSGPRDELLARLVARAHERGMITVAAADDGEDGPGFPASLPSVLAVLASDDRGRVSTPRWAAERRVLAAPASTS
jgi:subtilisin family serine protease